MHLIEKYSLETGALIGNPEIYEKYYPCPIEGDYITNFVDQSVSSMQYDYWEDVVSLINPTLIENNIKILNLNPSKVKDLANLTQIDEKIEAGQVSYLIRNSLLHFGETSFCTDLASMHDVKIVSLYSIPVIFILIFSVPRVFSVVLFFAFDVAHQAPPFVDLLFVLCSLLFVFIVLWRSRSLVFVLFICF